MAGFRVVAFVKLPPPAACYVASWQLLRPDPHWLADDEFAGHTSALLARLVVVETVRLARV